MLRLRIALKQIWCHKATYHPEDIQDRSKCHSPDYILAGTKPGEEDGEVSDREGFGDNIDDEGTGPILRLMAAKLLRPLPVILSEGGKGSRWHQTSLVHRKQGDGFTV